MTLTLQPQGEPITPREYQREDIDAIEQALVTNDRVLYMAATGLGKTITFSHLLRERGGRGLILVHRDELVTQSIDKLGLCWPGVDVGVVKAERDEYRAQVVVASVQTLSRPARLQALMADALHNDRPFGTVVVDEAHHATADTYRRVLDALAPPGVKVVGVTATPKRADRAGLTYAGFTAIAGERPILWGIQQGYLSDLTGERVRVEVDLDNVRKSRGDYQDGALGDALIEAGAPKQIAAAVHEFAAARKSLIFTPTVAVAQAVAEELRALGLPCGFVSGETPLQERRATLAAFARGDLMALANCAVLTEGYDEPSVDCIVVARPTKSQALYVQMVGRGTRRYPGKHDCLVLDVVGVTGTQSLLTVGSLAGVDPDSITKDRSLAEVVAGVEREREERAAVGRRMIEAVQLFRPPDAMFAWTSKSRTRHVIQLGDRDGVKRRLVLAAAPDDVTQWSAWVEWAARPKFRGDPETVSVERVLVKRKAVDWAQGVAEDWLRAETATNRQAAALGRMDAPWRQQPASEKQLAALRKRRIPVWDGITKGQASDLMDAPRGGR